MRPLRVTRGGRTLSRTLNTTSADADENDPRWRPLDAPGGRPC
jgi:hypothetical protein